MKVLFTSCLNSDSARQGQRIAAVERVLHDTKVSTDKYIYSQTEPEGKLGFGQLAELILNSDVYIAEMSVPSQTLGFQISFALSNTKPCLYLYDEQTNGRPDSTLTKHPSRLLKIMSYDEQNLKNKIANFLKYAHKQLATKRTSFMSTQEIDRFLDADSRRLGVHKAELIRQILHDAAVQSVDSEHD